MDSIYTVFECKKGIHWSINGTGIMGWGWGHFCVLNTFVFFFRSLALVFQKSPTRNKEATRFTLNRNFATGSRIRNLLHQTLSLLTDKDRRTNCWIRRKQNMIRNNPDKSEFSNLLHCVLCTRLLILKAHVPSKVNLRARWREIYCKMYLRTKRSRIAVVVYLVLYLGWPNRPCVVFFRQGPQERATTTLKRRNATRRADRDKRHCSCFADVFR